MRDPIELFEYPSEWIRVRERIEGKKEVAEKIGSGLYILTPEGWLRRGITTATTASAAICGAVASLYEEVREVEVKTPVGLKVRIKVKARDGICTAKKFAGDHSFDVTNGIEIVAEAFEDGWGVEFGEGIGVKNGKKAVSASARKQIEENFKRYAELYGFKGRVVVSVPEGRSVAEKTKNSKLGVLGGVSLLGSTGFVEPWCEKLVRVKSMVANRYDRVVITTGRSGWRWALENLKGYQPFVFGVYLEEALKSVEGEVIIVGLPALLRRWVGGKNGDLRRAVLKKAMQINENVSDVILLGGGND